MSSELAEFLRFDHVDGGQRSVCEDLHHVKYKGKLSWNIPDFVEVMAFQEDHLAYKSSDLELKFDDQTRFTFRIHLQMNAKTEDNIDIFLLNLTDRTLQLRFMFCIVDESGVAVKKFVSAKKFLPNSPGTGFGNFLSKKEMKEPGTRLLPNRTLKLYCHLTIYTSQQSIITKEDLPTLEDEGTSLTQDVAKLWTNPEFTDFQLKCAGQVFRCHKTVLASRSDVFRAMFSNEHFSENLNKEAIIKDCEPEVLAKFLKFIYTDKLKKYQSVKMLLLVDRYNVTRLRVNCEKALIRIINCNNVVFFLCTASTISAPFLLRSAAKYIETHRRRIVGSPDWDEMVKNNPQAMAAIFKYGTP